MQKVNKPREISGKMSIFTLITEILDSYPKEQQLIYSCRDVST